MQPMFAQMWLFYYVHYTNTKPGIFAREKKLVKLRVETRATFATIFVATQVARLHAVTTRSLIVPLNSCDTHHHR